MITLVLTALLGILTVIAFGFKCMQILYIGIIVLAALIPISYLIYLIVKFKKSYIV